MKRFNFLFICTDQERAISEYPAGLRLPGRERLRKTGVTFTNFQANTTLCTSSRSVIYSGQHALKTGMWDNLNFSWISDLDGSISTLGHMMRRQGYYTAYKGRWLLSDLPDSGSQESLEPYGFADYQEDGDLWGRPQEGYKRDKDVAAGAHSWLLEKAAKIRRNQPWLLAVNFHNPRDIVYFDTDAGGDAHGPGAIPNVSAPADPIYSHDWQPELPASFEDGLSHHPEGVGAYGRFVAGVHGFIPHERRDLWQAHISNYYNCLVDSDQCLEEVLVALAESGEADNTIIIFTSDHGEMGTAHGLRQSGSAAFREATNVPFIVCHPGLQSQVATKGLGSSVDIVPTILGLSGMNQADIKNKYSQISGRDLSGLIKDPTKSGPRGSADDRKDGVLFTYDNLHSLDVEWFLRHAADLSDLRYALGEPRESVQAPDLSDIEQPEMSRRRLFRGVFDGRFKLIRYFSPDNYNIPSDISEMLENNDLALYDLVQDPSELNNLANLSNPGYDETLLVEMNAKLNKLIEKELGEDRSVMENVFSAPFGTVGPKNSGITN